MSSWLFGVSATDPFVYVLLTAALAACHLPARRANEGRSDGGAAVRVSVTFEKRKASTDPAEGSRARDDKN
jgi:hypothetical protein